MLYVIFGFKFDIKLKNCHVENVVLGKDFNFGMTSSFFHVFTPMYIFPTHGSLMTCLIVEISTNHF